MDRNEVTSNDLNKKNVFNDYEIKIASNLDISKSSRRNSMSSDIKNNSANKSSSSNTPVIKTMLKCVLQLGDKDLKPQIKAESLSIINGILGSVSSVLQRQIMRKILLNMGLEDILPSLLIYKCKRLNEELKIFENGQRLEESIQLSKTGKHPLNIFSEAYMKLASNKECLTLFMEIIEKIALCSEVTKNDISKLYFLLTKTNEKYELSKDKGYSTKDLSNNNIVNENWTFNNEFITTTSNKLENNNNSIFKDFNCDCDILTSTYLHNVKEENSERKSTDVEVQTEYQQQMSLNVVLEKDTNTNLGIVNNKSKPPGAPPLPNFKNNISLTGENSSVDVQEEKVMVNSSSNKVFLPPPPPPPLPSLSLKINDKNFKPAFKMPQKYNKVKLTNVVSWTPIKINSLESGKTIWNKFVEPEFPESERNKLELIFEKPQKIPRRLTISTFGRQSKDCLSLNTDNNRQSTKGLSEKRVLNLGIVLSRFKLKGVNLVEALDSEKCSTFDIDLLSNLLLQYPTEDEKKYFQNIDESSTLNSIEAFVWAVSRKPHLKINLELIVFEANFQVDSKNYIQTAEQCLDTYKKLYQNSNIDKFFHKCLQIGNFLNQDKHNGNAYGFTLNSFVNILTFKGTVTNKSSSIRIIDLLVESEIFNIKEINILCDELEKIKFFNLNDFETMSNKICQQLNAFKAKFEATELFITMKEMNHFFTNKINTCNKLKQLVNDIKSLENDLQKYYCADKLKIEEITSILLQAFDLLKKTYLAYEYDKSHSERYPKVQHSFGKPLDKLRNRIVKCDM